MIPRRLSIGIISMLVVLSPAKKQNIDNDLACYLKSIPKYKAQSEILVKALRTKSTGEIQQLMKISLDLAKLNKTRFEDFDCCFADKEKLAPAIMAFQGDAYQALDAASLPDCELEFCNQNFMIISGLYGLLKPLDAMQAYRLEMKTPLSSAYGKNLYDFWGNKLSSRLCHVLKSHENKAIINLASKEYSKAIKDKESQPHIIDIDFKEHKDGEYKTIGIHAKKARGLMARFIIMNKINSPLAIKEFDASNYQYNAAMSKPNLYTFARS
jgi:uncharacterized protein